MSEIFTKQKYFLYKTKIIFYLQFPFVRCHAKLMYIQKYKNARIFVQDEGKLNQKTKDTKGQG